MALDEPRIKNLVVDAVGFLKAVPLQNLGQNIYTIRNVVDEIRDLATKQRLQVLPYELRYIEPTQENLKHVTDFSKKTGDFPSLSATDLQLIAAVYQLEKEFGDATRLRKEPILTKSYSTSKKLLENPKDIIGFFLPKKDEASCDTDEIEPKLDAMTISNDQKQDVDVAENENEKEKDWSDMSSSESDSEGTDTYDDANSENEDSNSKLNETNEDENADDDGWITPGNVRSVLNKIRRDEGGEAEESEKPPIPVACLSSDFAIQNVLLHMGLHVTSVDGILIRRLRTYILRCFGCYQTTSVMTKRFCPNCGNATLKKVAVTVNPNTGKLEYHISKRKKISTRGTKFSLPAPKGGKHSKNPVLAADQPESENRLSKKATQRLNALDPDYLARDSPFLMNDVTSRSAVIGIRGLQKSEERRNPNAWKHGRKRGGKKH